MSRKRGESIVSVVDAKDVKRACTEALTLKQNDIISAMGLKLRVLSVKRIYEGDDVMIHVESVIPALQRTLSKSYIYASRDPFSKEVSNGPNFSRPQVLLCVFIK